MTTFTIRFATDGAGVPGTRLAVKDAIDMAGLVTTAGCRAVAETALPAARDAACLAGARAAGARIVGRTNCHELTLGVTGVNPWLGTPTNPLDPVLIPGGSSSGSAVAVASGEADVALGTDTGGSVRIPAACCGVAGLRTTWGRIPLDGVWPLAPTLDTVGPLAAGMAGVALGMALLEPGFGPGAVPRRVGRIRVPAEPAVDLAVDRSLGAVGWEVEHLTVPEWAAVGGACGLLLVAEAWSTHRALAEARPDGISADVLRRLHQGRDAAPEALAEARALGAAWMTTVDAWWTDVDVVATPTLAILPPPLDRGDRLLAPEARCTLPASLAGLPALAVPVPTDGPLPASLQLIGPAGSEEMLVAAGLAVESAVAASCS